jgi:hypothetical protein
LGRKLEKLSRKAKADTGRALSLSEIRRELSQARGQADQNIRGLEHPYVWSSWNRPASTPGIEYPEQFRPVPRLQPLPGLEVTLLPTYHERASELAFYAEYFRAAECFDHLNRIFELAGREARANGIKVMDALHIAAASLAGCDRFVTWERRSSPLFRTRSVTAVHLFDLTS